MKLNNFFKLAVAASVLALGFLFWRVYFREPATRTVQLYYYNETRDREIADYIPCSPDAVLPVSRELSVEEASMRDTIELLLRGGLTDGERAQGFITEFPLEGFRLSTMNLSNGVLTLIFDDPLNKTGGGSCRAGLLWAQIEKTAKQFFEVREVKFEPEFLFQP